MRQKIKKGIAMLLGMVLTVAACVSALPQMALTAYAAGTGKSIQLGANALNDNVNTANAPIVYYDNDSDAWRVVGYDGTGVAGTSGAITLIANGNIAFGYYDSDSPYSNNYSGSNLQNMIGTIAGRLSTAEASAVVARTLEGGSANYDKTGYADNKISGDPVSNAVMWPLSVAEANVLNADLRRLDGGTGRNWASDYWWLRSPGYNDGYATVVYGNGHVYYYVSNANNREYGVRPAFNIDLESVIFSSAISSESGSYKLTIKDGSMSAGVTSGQEVTRSGDTITVPYTVSDGTNRVSVLITDGEYTLGSSSLPDMKYYGALTIDGGTIGTSGTGTFTLPTGYQDSWKVYILAEKTSGDDKLTDYASVPEPISIPDASGTTPSPTPAYVDKNTEGAASGDKPSDIPEEEDTVSYLDELRTMLSAAAAKGGAQTIYWDKGTALPYDIMKTLQDNSKITLVFSYTYQGKDYKVTIPGSSVKADPAIPWYGPLCLYELYGTYNAKTPAATVNTKAGSRTYTVISGDTLSAIARELGTTVRSLTELNNIADPNRISIGQVIKY